MTIKIYTVKILNFWNERKRKKRAKKFELDESLPDNMSARIKNYPPELIHKNHPRYHDFD